jgi:leucyl-tRNA synthetase
MKEYNPAIIEKKWQDHWEKERVSRLKSTTPSQSTIL